MTLANKNETPLSFNMISTKIIVKNGAESIIIKILNKKNAVFLLLTITVMVESYHLILSLKEKNIWKLKIIYKDILMYKKINVLLVAMIMLEQMKILLLYDKILKLDLLNSIIQKSIYSALRTIRRMGILL